MYLPAIDRQIINTQEPRPRKAPAVRKILFMDDEEMLRNVNRSMLESLGYEVETACNGEEAIELYTTAKGAGLPFGAVILDLTIKGGLGGRETIKRLREFDPDIRAIVASGYSTDPVMANFREYGFLAALDKPYQLRDLEKSLGGIVDAAEDR
jgi:CheY-like chemotaxis protein